MKLWRYGLALERLGQRYRLDGVLGSGGMADVCLAWDEHEGREVAVKVIKSNELNQRSLDRFLKEASHVSHWRHPHILRIYGDARVQLLSEAQGSMVPYIVMEYAQGGDLHKRLQPGMPYAFAETLHIFEQLCQAVSYAHSQGVIHRDLKPLNILFRILPDKTEQMVLSDFGLAVEMAATHFTFAAGGTLPYMAPEQLRGHAQAASDIFALGVILYQLCTGRYPFRRSIQDLRQRGPQVPPPLPSTLYRLLPPELDDVILKALSEDPAERFADALDFWDSVNAVVDADTVEAILRNQSGPRSARNSQSSLPSTPPPAPSSRGDSPSPLPISLVPTRRASAGVRNSVQRDSATNVPAPRTKLLSASQLDLRDSDPALNELQTNVADIPARSQQSNPSELQTGMPVRSQHRSVRRSPVPARPPVTSRAPNLPPTSQHPRRAQLSSARRLLWLVPAVLIVLIGGLFFVYRPGSPLPQVPLLHPAATITLTPASKLLTNSYSLTAVTAAPDAAQSQIAAHQLTSTSQSQTQTVQGTGHMKTLGSMAKGMLTFLNGSATPFTVDAGVTVSDDNGISVTIDTSVTIPGANPPNLGSITVPARVTTVGNKGNILALDINKPCCSSGNFVATKNTSAFTGGQDPKDYMFVQQSDIDGIINPLRNTVMQQAQAGLQKQVRPQDGLVGTAQCTENKQLDPTTVGDRGQNLPTTTVLLSVQCAQMAYNKKAASELAQSRLREQARADEQLGAGYILLSNIDTSITVGAVSQQSVALQVQAQGRWVYAIDAARKQAFARLIAGKSSEQAKNILEHQMGLAGVFITVHGMQGDQLPNDVTQISFEVRTN